MKVLMINGSVHGEGCTYTALMEVAKPLEEAGIEWELVNMGPNPVRDCIACGKCRELPNRCIFDDDLANRVLEKAEAADGFLFGSPVYYAHPSGRIQSLLDRVFYAGGALFAHKPGAVVVSARRAGTTASVDVLNKYLQISQMPVVSSSYWNMVHGNRPEDVMQDAEGLEIMGNLGRNMAWLMQCIDIAKKQGVNPPQNPRKARTNFIR